MSNAPNNFALTPDELKGKPRVADLSSIPGVVALPDWDPAALQAALATLGRKVTDLEAAELSRRLKEHDAAVEVGRTVQAVVPDAIEPMQVSGAGGVSVHQVGNRVTVYADEPEEQEIVGEPVVLQYARVVSRWTHEGSAYIDLLTNGWAKYIKANPCDSVGENVDVSTTLYLKLNDGHDADVGLVVADDDIVGYLEGDGEEAAPDADETPYDGYVVAETGEGGAWLMDRRIQWGKVTTDWSDGEPNNVYVNPCARDGTDVHDTIIVRVYLSTPLATAPPSCPLVKDDVIAYHLVRNATDDGWDGLWVRGHTRPTPVLCNPRPPCGPAGYEYDTEGHMLGWWLWPEEYPGPYIWKSPFGIPEPAQPPW